MGWARIIVCIVLIGMVCLMGATTGNSVRKQKLRIAFGAGTLGFDPHTQAPPDMEAFVNAILYRRLMRLKTEDFRLRDFHSGPWEY